ncbi:MAG: hypothetical protein CMC05_03875 [Flavobacteriaceae bacterium]|nr:hypothetical protein [Flavobacteriaceae bacterium]|tara:strand:+ start:485 stop:1144 length:660 start_codon:yes stop_codon:yes gene_type:complete
MKVLPLHTIKAVFTIMFVVVFTSINFAQEVSEDSIKEIDSMASKMFTDMNNRDYDAIIEMTHPKVFDLVPKETMVSVFKSTLEGNSEFSIEIPKQIPEYKISDVFKDEEGGSDYAFVSYDMEMSMTFNNESFDEETKETMVKMMKMQGMDAEFISDKTVHLNMLNRMTILIKDESTNNKWAMINYDPDSPLFFQLLSATVIEKAKSYYQDLMIAQKKKD